MHSPIANVGWSLAQFALLGVLLVDVTAALQAITDLETLEQLGLTVLDTQDLDAFRQQIPSAQS